MSDHNIPLWEKDGEASFPRSLRKPNAFANVQTPENTGNAANESEQKGRTPELRRPNIPSNTQTLQTMDASKTNDPTNLDVSKSSLSVDAKEWYPPNFDTSSINNTGGNSSIQSRLTRPRVSQNTEHSRQEIDTDIRRFNSIVNTLTNDPGQFDDLVVLFMETLSPYFSNIEVILVVSQLLFEQAIREPNFRYTAARLCCIIEEPSPLFRSQLHMTCEKEMNNNAQQQDLLLFVAELYTQLKYGNVYANSLLQIMQNLLTNSNADDVKHVCQALKLTGRSLECYNKLVINEIFTQLDACRPLLNPSVMSLLNSIIALRNSNWGASLPPIVNNSTLQEDYYCNPYDGNLIYCPDGQELSLEERNFLADNIEQSHDFLGDDSDPDELCDPEPEMDEEIQAAFKDFVKLSKR